MFQTNLFHLQITRIEQGTFGRMPTLHALRLSNNELTTIESNAFTDGSKINDLWLNNNKIDEISDLPPNVRNLDLSENQLSVMPPVLTSLTQLIHLNISHNNIDGRAQAVMDSNNLQVCTVVCTALCLFYIILLSILELF